MLAWIERADDDQIYLSAVTLGELQAGVEAARRQDPGKAKEIEEWVDRIAESHQVLPMNSAWARLMDGEPDHLLEDAMIAATARIHRLTVVTRSTKDFERFGVSVINPFTTSRA